MAERLEQVFVNTDQEVRIFFKKMGRRVVTGSGRAIIEGQTIVTGNSLEIVTMKIDDQEHSFVPVKTKFTGINKKIYVLTEELPYNW